MGVNSLPKTVTGQRRGCDLNPGPSAPESGTLTTQGYRVDNYNIVRALIERVYVCIVLTRVCEMCIRWVVVSVAWWHKSLAIGLVKQTVVQSNQFHYPSLL